MGQADEGRPAVILRGFSSIRRGGNAGELVREVKTDLFR
jgi:F420-0:gamma-glutamyl ligase